MPTIVPFYAALLAGLYIFLSMRVIRMRGVGDPFSFSKGNFLAFVSKTLGLVVPARQRTRPNDLHADPNAQADSKLGFHPQCQFGIAVLRDVGIRVDLNQDLVQALFSADERHKLARLREGSDDLLDSSRVNYNPTNFLHVVQRSEERRVG